MIKISDHGVYVRLDQIERVLAQLVIIADCLRDSNMFSGGTEKNKDFQENSKKFYEAVQKLNNPQYVYGD